MYLMDVNILVYAFRKETTWHTLCHDWMESLVNGSSSYGISELVCSGFLRIVTHPKIFEEPADRASAVQFIEQINSCPHALPVAPGAKHWSLFLQSIEEINARGNDIADAYHAALAIEWGCEWVTLDKGFRRFKKLRYHNLLR